MQGHYSYPGATSYVHRLAYEDGVRNHTYQPRPEDHPALRPDLESRTGSLSSQETVTVEHKRGPVARYFLAEINPHRTYLLLIICSFIAGLVDALSYNAWSTFTGMQTGNTVFMALGASNQPSYPDYLWAKALIAFSIYLLSNFFFSYVARALNPLRRTTMLLIFGLQTLALLIAALLVELEVILPRPEDYTAPIQWTQVIAIALLSFSQAGQISASRILGYNEVPTLSVTTILADMIADPHLFELHNPKRNRRLAGFIASFVGAMTSGFLSRETEMVACLWLAMALKVVVTLCFFVWRDDREAEKKDLESQ